MLVLVVYDIPNNKRRTKLATFLRGYGRRVQYSEFECFISLDEMKKLHQKVMGRLSQPKIMSGFTGFQRMSCSLAVGSEQPASPAQFYII